MAPQTGLEPVTYCLEGSCYCPAELLGHINKAHIYPIKSWVLIQQKLVAVRAFKNYLLSTSSSAMPSTSAPRNPAASGMTLPVTNTQPQAPMRTTDFAIEINK